MSTSRQSPFLRPSKAKTKRTEKLSDFIGFLSSTFPYGLRIMGTSIRVSFGPRDSKRNSHPKRQSRLRESSCASRMTRERSWSGSISVDWDFRWESLLLCVFSCLSKGLICRVLSRESPFVVSMGLYCRLLWLLSFWD